MSKELQRQRVQEGSLLNSSTIDYYVAPKEAWGPGEWDNEPDRIEFETGYYPSIILRNTYGSLNGYIAVKEGHPWFLQNYDQIRSSSLELSWASHEDALLPLPSGWTMAWWVGFTRSSYFDLMPALEVMMRREALQEQPSWLFRSPRTTYKSIPFIKAQLQILAQHADHAMTIAELGHTVERR